MKPKKRTPSPFQRKNMRLMASAEVNGVNGSNALAFCKSKYDEDYFEDPRVDYSYKACVATALVERFGALAIPLWRREAA